MSTTTCRSWLLLQWVYYCIVTSYVGASQYDVEEIPSKILWRRRESHHTTSSVMIADRHKATVWIYSPRHVKGEDPVNTILKYSRHNNTGTTIPTAHYDWKYEFSCRSLPSLALAESHGDIWALGCPSQQVPLYNGQQLTSESGSVTLFQWIPHKNRARIVQTIYGKNSTDQLGQSISMSHDGRTVALVATAHHRSSKNTDSRDYLNVYQQQQQQQVHGGTSKQQWVPKGDTFQDVTRAVLSSDGSILATTTTGKAFKIFSWDVHNNKWTEERIQTNRQRGLSSSSLSLSGNGQVLSILLPAKGGQAVTIFRRTTLGTTVQWIRDSTIHQSSESSGTTSSRNRQSSFGWVTSLSGDGNRIAIAEPSAENTRGLVRVYDYCNRGSRNSKEWITVGKDIRGRNQLDSLGRHVHLSYDGTVLVVKAVTYTIIYEFVVEEGYYDRQSACKRSMTTTAPIERQGQNRPRRYGTDEL
ncbi:expressed unknown protein [Seminavis robusta]|uniref:Uncharacterized protein n=1 Tax=Seminavis robusta TaxID=568900 RepID=A0A9N8DFU6_9STRA|nr:expressed unknown protein [Seminavis robusta]|eukprot:Sro72_g040070.1 n/a (471) ;mRNA; r:114225-115637